MNLQTPDPHMSNAIPIRNDDAPRRLRLLRMVVDVLVTQAETAKVIGVESSTVSQWLSGKRGPPDWYIVLGAIRRTLQSHPECAPAFIEVIAGDILDQEGSWKPRPVGEPGEYSDESADVTVVHGELTQGVRERNPAKVRKAAREIVQQAEEAGIAALREVEEEPEPLRVAK